MDEENKTNNMKTENHTKRWSEILFGNQFLKLYFYHNGISSSLIVDRFIRSDDLRIKKPSQDFKLGIIRTRPNEKNLFQEKSQDKEKIHSYSRLDFESYEEFFEENQFLFFVILKFFIHSFNLLV
jgi:hypothetical protein